MFQWTKQNQHYSVEVLAKLLVANPVSKEKICTKQPLRVCQNVSFIVDLHSLDDPHDIRVDENGVWKRKGSPVAYVSIHTQKSGEKKVFKHSRIGDHPHHYKLTRTYYRHTSSPDFTRIITTVHGERCFCDPVVNTYIMYLLDYLVGELSENVHKIAFSINFRVTIEFAIVMYYRDNAITQPRSHPILHYYKGMRPGAHNPSAPDETKAG